MVSGLEAFLDGIRAKGFSRASDGAKALDGDRIVKRLLKHREALVVRNTMVRPGKCSG